jgi:hypothetical protein
MGKLASIGAVILGLSGMPSVTPPQAERAIRRSLSVPQVVRVVCMAAGRDQLCQVSDSAPYVDAVFGPAEIVGTTVCRVSRGRHGYRVRIVVPERFDIYVGEAAHAQAR